MSDVRNLPVIGEPFLDSDWDEVEESVEEIEEKGMKVQKILNYKGGSTKFIASVEKGKTVTAIRPGLEALGWKLLSPYYSHGKIVGFKVAKDRKASESESSWGGL